MSKFYNYLQERSSEYGLGLNLIDIDETLLNTYAKIYVLNKDTKEIIRKLDNQEFNTYELQPNEEFDFREFRDSVLFNKTSKPIQPMIDRLKRMITMLKKNDRGSWIVLLTARSDFDNKEVFLSTFKKLGIDVNFPNLYIERSGNIKTGTVSEKKKKIIFKYLNKYNFRRVRMFDDDIKNLETFIKITKDKDLIPIKNKVKKVYNIPDGESIMDFYALQVNNTGKIKLLKKEEVL